MKFENVGGLSRLNKICDDSFVPYMSNQEWKIADSNQRLFQV